MTGSLFQTAELTDAQFAAISETVRQLCGIHLHEGKMALVKARLNKRLRALGLTGYGQYVERIRQDVGGSEAAAMLDALSTNHTFFFREPQHFEALRRSVVPAMLARHRGDRRLRLWSAGCSSGEEPYSMAITLKETVADLQRWDVGILATDLSHRVLHAAQEGIYAEDRLRETPSKQVMEHFTCLADRPQRRYRVSDALRKMVHFAHLNLVDPWPMKGLFDVIFCRNVMIYFDKPTQQRLIDRFWGQLAQGGTLFIGHSESLAGVRHRFRYIRPTVYEKP
jgi:chemotaxis protein methyltransferase CheR